VICRPATAPVLVTAAHLIAAGANEVEAVEVCVLAPLSTDGAITDGLRETVAATFIARQEGAIHQ
jgi:hypothetical protein